MLVTLIIISYKFYLSGSGGIAIPYQDIAGGRRNSAVVSVGLGLAEYDTFYSGANFNFHPSLNLFSLGADVGLRLDSETFSSSLGGAIGPGFLVKGGKSYAHLLLSAALRVGTYIVPLRLVGFISPSFSAYLGPLGGYILSISAGFDLFSGR